MSYYGRPTQAPRPKTRRDATCCPKPRVIGVVCLSCGADQRERRPRLRELPNPNDPEAA